MGIYNHLSNVLVLKNPRELYKKYSKEINEQILTLNIVRIVNIIWVLLFSNSILVLTDILIFRGKLAESAYRNVFYLHLSLYPILLFYLALYHIKIRNPNNYKYINLSINIIMIIWSELLSFNAQFIHCQISAYLLTLFCMSALLIIPPAQSLIIFPSAFISLVIGMLITGISDTMLYGHITNSFFMVVISLFISIISYSTFCGHVINQQIIADKNREIDALNEELIRKVQSQTDELVKMNSTLELEKLRISLFANISHEFKTPINVILSAEQLLEYKLKDDQSPISASCMKKYMSSIKQNCYRLIRIVTNIIDINTIDCGNMHLQLENRDIVKTTEDIVLSVAGLIQNKNISLIFDTEMEEKVIAIDLDKIERVILNLLSNAMKFTSPGGSIMVNMSEQDNYVLISVKDTGIGIPEELQSAIFDRLVQVDRSFTKSSEGSGIGLSISKSIIDMHGGRIYVNSQVGEGSEFIVELPSYTIEGTKAEAAAVDEMDRIEKVKIEFSDIYL